MVMVSWEGRVRELASHIEIGDFVLDVGAGTLALRDYIHPTCRYYPIDVNPHSSIVQRIDLETTRLIDELPYHFNVAVLSGLLEHVTRPLEVLADAISLSDRVLFSYDHSVASRVDVRWKSRLTQNEVAAAVHAVGRELRWIGSWKEQMLYEVP